MSRHRSILSDEELFAQLRGEKKLADSAFEELFNRHSQRIYDYCFCVTGSSDETNDIFQETFIKFYKSARQERLMSNVPAFLLRIARNTCIDHKRRKKNIETLDLNSSGELLIQSYEQKELLDLIAASLEVLDFDHREAFVLRLYQGYEYEEIAELTGESINTIRNRVWRAKEKVKLILTPYLEDLNKI